MNVLEFLAVTILGLGGMGTTFLTGWRHQRTTERLARQEREHKLLVIAYEALSRWLVSATDEAEALAEEFIRTRRPIIGGREMHRIYTAEIESTWYAWSSEIRVDVENFVELFRKLLDEFESQQVQTESTDDRHDASDDRIRLVPPGSLPPARVALEKLWPAAERVRTQISRELIPRTSRGRGREGPGDGSPPGGMSVVTGGKG